MLVDEKKKNGSMYVCLVAAFFAIANMYTGNSMFMMLFTALVATAIFIAKRENKIDFLIFFSTWAYVLKFDVKTYSMFLFLTIEYCLLMLPSLFEKKVDFKLTFALIFFLGVSFIVSAFATDGINNVLGVLVNYLAVALTAISCSSAKNFKKWIWLYVIGLLMQCIVAYLALGSFGNVGDYLLQLRDDTVRTSMGVLARFSGFEIDPNYFSAEVLVGICCLIVLMMQEKKKTFPAIIMACLMFFGLLSFSKMYLLCLCILIVVALIMLFKQDVTYGSIMFFIFVVSAFFIWQMLGDVIMAGFGARLDGVSSLEGLTTGRTGTWANYLKEILTNIKVLLFGAGYGSGFVNAKAAHNGYLSLFYFWGVTGASAFICVIKNMDKVIAKTLVDIKKDLFSVNNLPFSMLLLANFSLDCVLMDFFPMAIFLTMICRHYGALENETQLKAVG